MIKKLLGFLVLILAFSISAAIMVNAQTTGVSIVAPDYFPRPVESTNFLGQNHNYSVTFRGNGEAVVSARIIFSNLEEATMSAMTLRVPRVVPQDVMVYQISREPQCIRYRSYDSPTSSVTPDGNMMYQESLRIKPITPVCEEYQEPDYTQYWYGGNTYHKAQVTTGTDSITISLPKPVKPNGSGAFILYYRAVGYAKKDMFGAFNYTFETLKVEDRIQSLQVGISTDSDLVMKEAKGKVNYQTSMAAAPAAELRADSAGAAFKNSQLDNVIQQIGYGTIVKTSSNLQPLDSYKVTGAFAEAEWMLYGNQISGWIIAVLVILIIVIFAVRFLVMWLKKHRQDSSKQKSSGNQAMFAIEVVALSFISSLLIGGYCIAVFFVLTMFERMFSYYSGFLGVFVVLMLAAVSFAVLSFLLFGPAIFVGLKQGMWKGAIVFSATVAWLVMFFMVILIILFTFRYSPSYPTPIYNMMGASAGSADVMMK